MSNRSQVYNDAMSGENYLNALTIGRIARKKLTANQEGTIFGATSRGAFLHLPTGWIIFLSKEHFTGPMTITFRNRADVLDNLKPGQKAIILDNEIHIPQENIHVLLHQANQKEPEQPLLDNIEYQHQQERFECLARGILSNKGDAGFIPLLAYWFHVPINQTLGEDLQRIYDCLCAVYKSDNTTINIKTLIKSLIFLLGMGRGLTPSGDDLISGYLLTLNRWQVSFPQTKRILPGLNKQIISQAYLKTTTLSANLIECATLGLADARLIDAIDYIFTGDPPLVKTLPGLLEWGSSSGGDALVGIGFALTHWNTTLPR
jgi:hypothetical protein